MLKFVIGIYLAFGAAAQAGEFNSAPVLKHCTEPASESCILAVYRAVRVEITKMGREADLDEKSGLPAALRSQLDKMAIRAEYIKDERKRAERLKEIESARACVDSGHCIFYAMMMTASWAAYGATVTNEPAIISAANAMVPDILDLYDRLLSMVEDRGVPCLEGLQVEYGIPFCLGAVALLTEIAEHQLLYGFDSDAEMTVARLASSLPKIPLPDTERDALAKWYVREALAPLEAKALVKRISQPRHDGFEEIDRFLDEYGGDADWLLYRLTRWLIEAGAIDKAQYLIGKIGDGRVARFAIYLLIDAAPEKISAEWLSKFLIQPTWSVEDLSEIIYNFTETNRVVDLLPFVDRIQDADLAAVILLEIVASDRDAMKEDVLSTFATTRGNYVTSERRAWLASTLAEMDRVDEARQILAATVDGEIAVLVFASMVEAAPTEISSEEVSAFLKVRAAEPGNPPLGELVSALVSVGRLDEAHQLFQSIDEPEDAAFALVTIIKSEPERITSQEVSDFLIAYGDKLESMTRYNLALDFVRAGHIQGARALVGMIDDTEEAADVLSVLLDVVSRDDYAEFRKRHPDLEAGLFLTGSLASQGYFEEARQLINATRDPYSATQALVDFIEAAPREVTPEEVMTFYFQNGNALNGDYRTRIANALVTADHLDEARFIVGELHEAWAQVEEDESVLATLLNTACSSDTIVPGSGNLLRQLFAEMLLEVEKEPRPCARSKILADVGNRLIHATRERP